MVALQPGDWGPLLFAAGMLALVIVGLLGRGREQGTPSCHDGWIIPSRHGRVRQPANAHRTSSKTTETDAVSDDPATPSPPS